MSDELVLKDSKIPMEKEYERRTRNMAFERYPDLFHIPEGVMYMISHQNYSGSLDWEENEYGYLKLLRDDVSVSFDDGVMYANGTVAAKLSFKDVYTNKNLTDIDKPLLDALFSVVLMKLRTELDKVCPPGYSNDIQFRARQPKDVRDFSDETLFDWYHKDLFNYTVTVYLPDLMRYLGYENISDAQRDALLTRIYRMSRVIGIMEFESRRFHSRKEFLLMNPGFDKNANVLYIQSSYMNKLVERVIRDQIPRMITQKGKEQPLLDSKGRQVNYPPLASIVKPEIASAKNKRAAEVVKQIALLVVDAGKQDPHIKISNLIGRCYDLSGDLLEADQEHDKRKKRQILRRTFEAVWKYIREYTDISEKYTYEEIIPITARDYEITLEFHHKT